MDSVKAARSVHDVLSGKKNEEIMSPEGVEEKLIEATCFFMTLTQGGKYRVYAAIVCPCNNPNHSHEARPVGRVHNTKDEATKAAGTHMALMGSAMLDPRALLGAIFGGEDKD